MKLGDNMTMEAYNVWRRSAPQKCRPPKIGDIPKHSAVDEESPESSTKNLTISPSDSREQKLDIPLDSSRNIVFPLESTSTTETFSPGSTFETRRNVSSSSVTDIQRYPSTAEYQQGNLHPNALNPFLLQCELKNPFESNLSKEKFSISQLPECPTSLTKLDERKNRVTIKLSSTEEYTNVRVKSPSDETLDSPRISSSPEEASERECLEVRKDSALFLEEAEGLSRPCEFFKTRGPRFVRPRRESSGYASNLGTFDEDRRNSSTVDIQQDLSAFLKDRRGSSTRRLSSRIGILKTEDSLTEEVITSTSERMPTTEVLSSRCLVSEEQENRDSLSSDDLRIRRTIHDTSESCVHEKQQESSRDVFNLTSLRETISPQLVTQASKNSLNRMVYQYSVPFFSEDLSRPESTQTTCSTYDDDEDVTVADTGASSLLASSVKKYQLLSTQSEDRADGEPRYTDRRISLQISQADDRFLPSTEAEEEEEESLFVKVQDTTKVKGKAEGKETRVQGIEDTDSSPIRKLSSPGEVGTSQRFLGDVSNVTVRPIYPYCPYSPYGSPQGSPRNRRKPLRESRRVSIDNREGALQLNQYTLLNSIGQGSYGIVKLVYNKHDKIYYAMKILSKKKLMKKAGIFGRMAPGRKGTANPLAKVYREIALLKKLDHPNVVKLVEVLDDPDEDNLYLVFERVERGEVLQVPTDKPLDEETARKNFRDVVMGVEYLHYQRIVHRDIKPSNLLVDSDGRVKIADLGVSAELRASGELLSGLAGTPAFAAPETTTPGAHYSGTPCDIWSMGVTLYSLVTGKIPWDGAGNIISVQVAVRTEPLKFPEVPTLSEKLRDLISKMLAKDPTQRCTLAEIKEHPWLTRDGTEPLPSEADNCRLPVTVTDEEVERVVTRVPKLDTLILIKTMLKQHSFQNPFPKKGRATSGDADKGSEGSSSDKTAASTRDAIRNAKSERFQKSGRSNSAPDSYNWQTNGRQVSVDSPLPPVTEASSQECEVEKR